MDESSCTGGCTCSGASTATGGLAPRPGSAGTPLEGPGVTRRGVLAGSAAVVALALGGCASSEEASSGSTTGTPASPESPDATDATDAASPTESSASPEGGATGEVLATTGEFPTGGGKVVETASGVVVVTQPADGQFKAFNGTCPHQGCPVTEVLENTIICNCHGSTFDAETGDRMEGPAPVGLTPVAIAVEGDQVVLA